MMCGNNISAALVPIRITECFVELLHANYNGLKNIDGSHTYLLIDFLGCP
jgi:hypothetical protein